MGRHEPKGVKIEGRWEDAIGRALSKRRPAGGWPERPKRAKKKVAKRKSKKR